MEMGRENSEAVRDLQAGTIFSYLQPVCADSPGIAGDFTEGCCPAGLMLSQFRGSAGVGVTGCGGWQIWVQSPALTLPL